MLNAMMVSWAVLVVCIGAFWLARVAKAELWSTVSLIVGIGALVSGIWFSCSYAADTCRHEQRVVDDHGVPHWKCLDPEPLCLERRRDWAHGEWICVKSQTEEK